MVINVSEKNSKIRTSYKKVPIATAVDVDVRRPPKAVTKERSTRGVWPLKAKAVAVVFIGLISANCTLKDICTPGYTATIRPPASYTTKLKKTQMTALSLPGDPSQYEEDHIISLELCGDPKDPRNLTPELWPKARIKDVKETQFHRAVCKGEMKLPDAQAQIVGYE